MKYLISIVLLASGLLFCWPAARAADSKSGDIADANNRPNETDLEAQSVDNFQIHAGWKPLFNGRDLDGWYTFLQEHGRNADPDHLISIDNGVIHLYRDAADGGNVPRGYIATREEFGNFHLRLQYRWGQKQFEPRASKTRGAGIYYHMLGDDRVWPTGLQYQIEEGNVGDLLALYGLQLDSWIKPETKDEARRTFRDEKSGGVPVVLGGSNIAYQTRSVMNEMAGWNTVEVIARDGKVTHVLNGKTVNRGDNVRVVDANDPTRSTPVTKGRIALEIESAEVEYRNIEIKGFHDEQSAGKSIEKREATQNESDLRVGAAAVNLRSDKSMVIAGSIEPRFAADQEGELRAVATVIERPGETKAAIVACDVLFVPRELTDAAVAEIEQKTGIPADHILINATHTHHAPSVVPVHGYGGVPEFHDELKRGIVRAVVEANSHLDGGDASLYFYLANEDSVGSNSRQLLEDGQITWGGQQEPSEKFRPTGPCDPQLPVLDFRSANGNSRAVLFNHSTHTIGTRSGRDTRSPSFYGLAAQELEAELGGVVGFLEGASGSTHNVAPKIPVPECIERLKADVRAARSKALPRQVDHLTAIRRAFKFHVRRFDEAEENSKVDNYVKKYAPQALNHYSEVFAKMRRQLRDRQGVEQETWIQAIAIGDIVIVGVPAEYFTVLGINIKQRSPFEHTFIAELANDWIGYLPDREAHRLGGYQTWMGLHSYAEVGTGERMADEVVELLNELAKTKSAANVGARNAKAVELPAETNGSPKEHSPRAEQTSFRLADPDLQIELIASEPNLVSPVAMSWDADGRMYVAEMSGYPVTGRLGRIRRLEDRDGDGRYGQAVTFCDGLNFPSSVMPYQKGVLVTDSPDILYLEDTDGDGRADIRRVEWTGFGTKGSQQLRANSLHWGLDNWIYVANGRCDGDVRRPDAPKDQVISIRARDFRFNPITRQGEAIVGRSQFGLIHDAWGERFLSLNTIPLRHVLLEDADVRRYPPAAAEAVINIAESNDSGRVYPIASPPKQFNTEQANYYNALCGLTIFTGGALGAEHEGNAFVCESLTSLVTRRVLEPIDASFVARRSGNEKDREFLASTDNWFHPVNLSAGPDGALYIVDFYREFVEHPEYVANSKDRGEVHWRNGSEFGRVWRVGRRNADANQVNRRPRLSGASSTELVSLLEHSVGWWRLTAQRLLVERQDLTIVPQLRTLLIQSDSPLARLHALCVLEGLDAATTSRAASGKSNETDERALDLASLRRALRDPDHHIRQHAIPLVMSVVDRIQDASTFRDDLIAMVDDPDARVRFQLALALGRDSDPRATRALAALLNSDDNPQLRLAAHCGVGANTWPLMRELLYNLAGKSRNELFLEQVGEQFASKASDQSLAECLEWLMADTTRSSESVRLAATAGLTRGLISRGRTLSNPALPQDLLSAGLLDKLRDCVVGAISVAKDPHRSAADRIRAATIAGSGDPTDVSTLVRELVQPDSPQPLQAAALWTAAQANDPHLWQELFNRWSEHTTSTRATILRESARSSVGTEVLIAAMEKEKLSVEELSASTRELLAQLHDKRLRQRVQPILAKAMPADRAEVLSRYANLAEHHGDAARGATIFKQNCQTCHAIHGIGQKVGPDLTSVASRRTDLLITDILDPSRQVSPDYINYFLLTNDGRTLSGLVAAETSDSVTLCREDGQQETVLRSNIEQLRASGKSIMPDGLEQKLSPAQLTDLLEFLHNPDVSKLN